MNLEKFSREELVDELSDIINQSIQPSFSVSDNLTEKFDEVITDIEGLGEEETPDPRLLSRIVTSVEDMKNEYKDMLLSAFESSITIAGRYYPDILPPFAEWCGRNSGLKVDSSTIPMVLSSYPFDALEIVLPQFLEHRDVLRGGSLENNVRSVLSYAKRQFGPHKNVPFSDWLNLIEKTIYTEENKESFKKQTGLPALFVSFGLQSKSDLENSLRFFTKVWPEIESLSSFQENGIKQAIKTSFSGANQGSIDQKIKILCSIDLEKQVGNFSSLITIKEGVLAAAEKHASPELKSEIEKNFLLNKSAVSIKKNTPQAL